jgi:hypothetical protein
VNQKLTLENAGDSAVVTVTECRTVQTKFGNKLVFVGITPEWDGPVETPLIPDTTGLKQLERIGLTAETCVGETLTFSRAPNPSGKPYWNIDVAKPQGAPSKRMAPSTAQPTAQKAVPQASAGDASVAQRREKVLAQYLLLWNAVALHMQSVCDSKNITVDAAAIQSAAATVWISWKDKGIQPDGSDAAKISQPAGEAPSVERGRIPAPSGKRIPPPSNTAPPDFSKFPPPQDADDDLPF